MFDNLIGFFFSGLLGLVLIAVVGLMARKAMLRNLKEREAPKGAALNSSEGDAED